MLWETMLEPCVSLLHSKEPDGEGGYVDTWGPDKAFRAAFVQSGGSGSGEAEKRDKGVPSGLYTVTSEERIAFGEFFERGGVAYRVTSEPVEVPSAATFHFWQFQAVRTDAHGN